MYSNFHNRQRIRWLGTLEMQKYMITRKFGVDAPYLLPPYVYLYFMESVAQGLGSDGWTWQYVSRSIIIGLNFDIVTFLTTETKVLKVNLIIKIVETEEQEGYSHTTGEQLDTISTSNTTTKRQNFFIRRKVWPFSE